MAFSLPRQHHLPAQLSMDLAHATEAHRTIRTNTNAPHCSLSNINIVLLTSVPALFPLAGLHENRTVQHSVLQLLYARWTTACSLTLAIRPNSTVARCQEWSDARVLPAGRDGPSLDEAAALSGLLLHVLPPLPPTSLPRAADSSFCSCSVGTALLGLLFAAAAAPAVFGLLLTVPAFQPAALALLVLVAATLLAEAAVVGLLLGEPLLGSRCRCTTIPAVSSRLVASPGGSLTGRCAASSTAAVVAALPAFQSFSMLTGGALNICHCCTRSCCCCRRICPMLLCSCPCASSPPKLLRKNAPGCCAVSACSCRPGTLSSKLPRQGPVTCCWYWLLLVQLPAVLRASPPCWQVPVPDVPR